MRMMAKIKNQAIRKELLFIQNQKYIKSLSFQKIIQQDIMINLCLPSKEFDEELLNEIQ